MLRMQDNDQHEKEQDAAYSTENTTSALDSEMHGVCGDFEMGCEPAAAIGKYRFMM